MDIAGTGFLTNYAYDLVNHKTTITQGAQQRIFQTDAAGRTIYTSEPERGVTRYSYTYSATSPCTGVGLCVTRTRPKANQTNPAVVTNTTTQYDSVGRPVSITYDDGVTPFRHFYYDTQTANGIGFDTGLPKGHLVGAIGPSSYELFRYDNMGSPFTTYQCMPSVCDIYQIRWFDLTGNTIQDLYYSGGNSGNSIYTQYSFNPAGQMTSVSGGQNNSVNGPSIVNVTQEGPSGPMTWTLGNGLWGGLSYDSMGRPTAASTCSNNSTVPYCGNNYPAVRYFANEAIAGGQATWKCDTSLNMCQNYYYDEFGRMNGMNSNTGLSFGYVYDRYGNRWNQNVLQGSGPSTSYSFNTNTNQINGFSYDAAGNLTSDGIHSYQYDADGNLLKVDGGSTATYVYSALNRRSESRTNGGATIHDYFYNLNGQRSAIWDGPSRTLLQAQTYWGTTPVAYYSGGSIHYQHQDWQGTERARTSYNGTLEGAYTSLPYGDGFGVAVGSDTDAYHYAQLDHDSESDTQHAQFRQYSSTQGRWMSPDPYDGSYDAGNPQSLNRYAYVNNNPLSNVDPSGLHVVDCMWDHCSPCPYCGGGGGGGSPTYTADTPPPGVSSSGPLSGQGAEATWLASGSIPWYSVQGGNLMLLVGSNMSWQPNPNWNLADPNNLNAGTYIDVASWFDMGPITSSSFQIAGNMPSYGFVAPNSGTPAPYNGTSYRIPLVPGTNYCGPGGYGSTSTRIDAACKQHDACYSTAGASWINNVFGTGGPAKQGAISSCNQQLCRAINLSGSTSQESGQAFFVGAVFGCIP